jgi:hypothetical protein
MVAFFSDDGDGGWSIEPLTDDVIVRVDRAVGLDFVVKEISDTDRGNQYYSAMKSMLEEHYHSKVLYERKVISTNLVLPKYQYLFGFKHKEGMCLILNKPIHKVIACGGALEKLNQNCFLINGLQFILQEVEDDRRWCYVPHCLCEQLQRCELTPHAKRLRVQLWEDKQPA